MTNTGLNPKYAWCDLARQGLPKRSAPERISDFLEIYGLFDEETAREQASRCIQCPNPSCVDGCPLCNPIPQWMLLTAEGRFLEAAAVLGSVTTMAEICTRLCDSDRLCESNCILEGKAEPVAIGAIEQFLSDYALAHGAVTTATAPPNGLRVAVIGSGPAGLACADELARMGYGVTIFDSALVPGGLLLNGVPAFKLEKSAVQRRIDLLKRRGVTFRLGVKLCEDIALTQLLAEFHAVFLGFDSRRSRLLEIPGANLKGVVQPIPFILRTATNLELEVAPPEVSGKRVLVLGAGDTAMDCLRTAIREGAGQTWCVYRGDEQDMRCNRRDYRDAREEGAQFIFRSAPVAVLGDETGRARHIRFVRTAPGRKDSSGRRTFAPVPGAEFEMEANWIVPALGFDPVPCPHSGDFAKLQTNPSGGLIVHENQMTSLPGVFAGGDIVRGPSLVLHAVRDGRRAAARIEAYLKRAAGRDLA
jgi:glutamate synthase (NADPH) small chain